MVVVVGPCCDGGEFAFDAFEMVVTMVTRVQVVRITSIATIESSCTLWVVFHK